MMRGRRRDRPLWLGLALLLFTGARARGQASETLDFWAPEAQVMAAARHPQRVSEAPASAQVITAEEIAAFGYRTLGEALQGLPGFFATTDRNYTSLWVRGFGRPSDFNNRVLIQVNGHRLNDNIYGQAFAGFDFSLDLASVERIEVVKGPASALYGDNAFFAVVNVVSRSAPDAPSARAQVEGASYGAHREFLDVSRAFAGGRQFYGAGSYRHADGQDLFFPEMRGSSDGLAKRADGAENFTLFTRLASPGWVLQGDYSRRTKRVPTAPYDSVFGDRRTMTTDTRYFLDLAMKERRLGDFVQISGRTYLDWYDYRGVYMYALSPVQPQTEADAVRSFWYGEDLNARFTFFGEKNSFLLGQDFEKNLLEHQFAAFDPPAPGTPDFNDNRAEYRWSVYAQQELDLPLSAALTLGLRYDRTQSFGHSWSPRLALVQHPWDGGSFKFLYGEAFRGPTVYERFYAVAPNVANPGIKPERIRTYEAAYEHAFGARGSASLSVFQNRIDDLIDQDPATGQYRNQAEVRTDGLELYGKASLVGGFSGRLGYTLQSTRVSGGDRLSNSPTHTGSVGLSRLLPFWKTRLSAEGFLISSRTTLDGRTLPATALLNASVRVHPWARSLTVYAGVRNLLDADYRAAATNNSVAAPIYAIAQDGRNFNLGAEYRFGGAHVRP